MKTKLPFILMLFIAGKVCAQTTITPIAFKDGDKYYKQTFIKSTSVLNRGAGTMSLDNNVSVYRLYTVDNTPGNDYFLKIETKKIADTLNGMGQHLYYDSEKQTNEKSSIAQSLEDIIGKTTTVTVNNAGLIKSVTHNYTPGKNDSLFMFSGFISDKLIAGNAIELIARLPLVSLLKKGDKWTDSVTTAQGKDVIKYTIDEITASAMKISFTSTGTKHYNFTQSNLPVTCHLSNNETGYMNVDNKTAIITGRYVKIASKGYESINGISFAIEKNSTLTETVSKY